MTVPLPVIPNVYRCTLNWRHTTTSQTAKNVIHLETTTSGHTPGQVFTTLDASVVAGLWGTISNNAGVDSVDIIPLDGSTATTNWSTARTTKWVGNVADPSFAPQVSALIKLQTTFRGRHRRGRIYLPFTAELAFSNGNLGSGIVTPMQTAWTDFLASLATAAVPCHLTIAAYDRAHSGAGALSTNVFTATVETLTATQRRRQPGRKISRH